MCLMMRYHQEQRESFRLIRAWHFGTFVKNAGVQYAQILLSNHLLTHIYDSIWESMKIMSELDPRNRQNLHFSKSVGVILGRILSRPWSGLTFPVHTQHLTMRRDPGKDLTNTRATLVIDPNTMDF